MSKIVVNEVFAIRNGESLTISDAQPTCGYWIAVIARSVSMPDGPRATSRHHDGAPIEQLAVLACQQGENGWQWAYLSPATKESIGDLMIDSYAEKDRWYFVSFSQPTNNVDVSLEPGGAAGRQS